MEFKGTSECGVFRPLHAQPAKCAVCKLLITEHSEGAVKDTKHIQQAITYLGLLAGPPAIAPSTWVYPQSMLTDHHHSWQCRGHRARSGDEGSESRRDTQQQRFSEAARGTCCRDDSIAGH